MKKLLSIALSLVMVMTMLPTFAITAFAYTEGAIAGTTGIGTLGNPIICDTYAEVKAAMENNDITYVQLNPVSTTNGRIESTKAAGTIWAGIDVNSTKVLIVNGDSTFSAMLTSDKMPVDRLFHINSTGSVTVQGKGSITFRSSLSNGSNAIFYNQGSLTINDNISFNASYNATSNTKAIWQDSGSLTINGGTFSAVSAIGKDTRQVVALYANRGTVKINNGTFTATAENGSLIECFGAEIRTATVTIKEGTFNKGILYSGSLSSYIDKQSRYTIGTDGTVNVELNDFKINLNGNGNPKAFYDGKQITGRFEGERVNLSADATYNGQKFYMWYSDDVTISNPTQYNNASFVMPAKDVTVTAVYTDTSKYSITTVGVGNPKAYYLGAEITSQEEGKAVLLLTAATYADQIFDRWESDDVTITNPTKADGASFTMPNKPVIVRAVYKDAYSKYSITVNGEGNPNAYSAGKIITEQVEGQPVALAADRSYNDKVFDKWVSSDVVISNATSPNSASFTMPSKNVTITATYKAAHVHNYTVVQTAQVNATCTKAGTTAVMKCSGCDATTGGDVIQPTGEHTAGTPVKENVVAATSGKAGSYDEVTYCTGCKTEMSRVKKTTPPANQYILGDTNSDGVINAKDVLLLRKYLAKYQNLVINLQAADCNEDGKVDAKDVLLLRKYLAKWNVTLGKAK